MEHLGGRRRRIRLLAGAERAHHLPWGPQPGNRCECPRGRERVRGRRHRPVGVLPADDGGSVRADPRVGQRAGPQRLDQPEPAQPGRGRRLRNEGGQRRAVGRGRPQLPERWRYRTPPNISYPLVPYRRLANAPVLEFWGAVQTSTEHAALTPTISYTFGTLCGLRSLFNTTPANLLFGAKAGDGAVAHGGPGDRRGLHQPRGDTGWPLLRPQPRRVEHQRLLWGGLKQHGNFPSSFQSCDGDRQRASPAGISPDTAPAVGLGDPDYQGNLHALRLPESGGRRRVQRSPGGHSLRTTTVWAMVMEKVA